MDDASRLARLFYRLGLVRTPELPADSPSTSMVAVQRPTPSTSLNGPLGDMIRGYAYSQRHQRFIQHLAGNDPVQSLTRTVEPEAWEVRRARGPFTHTARMQAGAPTIEYSEVPA